MDNIISIEDNSKLFLNELHGSKMQEMLFASGMELYKNITNYMVEDNIVDTGRLKGSISFSTPVVNYNNPIPANKPNDFIQNVNEKNTVAYGSNVEYATYVDEGTSKQKARKYMEIGTNRAMPTIRTTITKILKGE